MTLNSFNMNDFSGNSDKEAVVGNYFIVDWVGNNPMQGGRRTPRTIVANATAKDLEAIKAKKVTLPLPMPGTAQRLILKIESVESL